MISYAQNFEDVILNRVFGMRDTGFYIDIGAMDPMDGSVTKAFYDAGWRGINVEPDLRFYEKLVAERARDINISLAVGETSEIKSLYLFEAQGISTFNPAFRDYFATKGFSWVEVPCHLTTLADICREHISSPIDFLKIDAEGWEGPILRGADWRNFRPVVLVIEATEPFSHIPAWQDWEPFLIEQCGYQFVYFDGLNRFYLRDESLDLQPLFAFPPNVMDNFQLFATAQAQRRSDEARVELDQLKEIIDTQRLALASLQDQLSRECQRSNDLERRLVESRLWIGRLSEALAVVKR